MFRTILSGLVFVLGSYAMAAAQAPAVVDYVDLNRYLGTWYEIASFPQKFSKGCVASMAEYSLESNGEIKVVNSCRQDTFDGKLREFTGRARVVDTTTNAKLEVSFFPAIWGDYWIIELDKKYKWAAVGVPGRTSLWILSRTPQMRKSVYKKILKRLEAKGFDTTQLEITPQP